MANVTEFRNMTDGIAFQRTDVIATKHRFYGESIQISFFRDGYAGAYDMTVTDKAAKKLLKQLIAELVPDEA